MKKNTFLPILFLMTLPLLSLSQETKKDAIKVTYGVFLKKVVPNFKEGTFYSEFYWWIKFKNDSTQSGWSNDDIINIEYVNACQSAIGSSAAEIQEKKIIGKDEYYYTGYHQGDFYFNPDYSSYPFDIQSLNITIENSLIPSTDLVFCVDTTSFLSSGADKRFFGISNDLLNAKTTNFNISKTEISTLSGIYNSNFGDPEFPNQSSYSRLNIGVFINRSFVPFITKLIIPLAIILFLVYFVFFIPADKIDIAAGLTVTSLLSAIAFQLSVNSDLPEIGYIIYVDKVFYSCYFLIAISMAESLYTFYLDKSGEAEKIRLAKRIDQISRFLFPILFAASIYLFA
ncbi:MAG: hypothetical protein FJ340_07640 [Sphingomonadales bacterium]|jgi:hypothetical protein|nr:hypothetical protein [Sphingomonadales bacterium]